MWNDMFPDKPSYTNIAEAERVSVNLVQWFTMEFFVEGIVKNPKTNNTARAEPRREGYAFKTKLGYEVVKFLLALCAEDPTSPLYSYVDEIGKEFQNYISITFIAAF